MYTVMYTSIRELTCKHKKKSVGYSLSLLCVCAVDISAGLLSVLGYRAAALTEESS